MRKKAELFIYFFILAGFVNSALSNNIPVMNVNSKDFIQEWIVCGPFPNPLKEGVTEYLHDETTLGFYIDYLKSAGGETGIIPEPGLKITGPDNQIRQWHLVNEDNDYIDLKKIFNTTVPAVGYAACYLESNKDQQIMLGLGSNDGIRAWLNGEMIWDNHRSRGATKDNDWVWTNVKKGKNLLLLKIDQGRGSWGFYARVVDPEEKIKELAQNTNPDFLIEKKWSDKELTLNIGRTSRLMLLEKKPVYKTLLINGKGTVLAERNSILGKPVTLSWKDQPDGPYWIKSEVTINQKVKEIEPIFIFKGESKLKLKLYGPNGTPVTYKPLVEMLDSNFIKLENGVKDNGDGTFTLLRPDVSTFYLNVLLEAPDLGRRLYLLDNNGKGFKIPANKQFEIDLPIEAAKTLYQHTLEISRKKDCESWLKKNLAKRLEGIDEKLINNNPYAVLDRLYTLKSKLLTQNNANIWYCPSIEKVSRVEPVPGFELQGINLSLAKHEYEPFQIVINPDKILPDVSINVSDLHTSNGAAINNENISIQFVEYVEIQDTSDVFGSRGWWPDALPDLNTLVTLNANQNQPFWITVYANPDQQAGIYIGNIQIMSRNKKIAQIPLTVQVYDFTLSKETHTETAYGIHINKDYHGNLTKEQEKQTYDLYMQFCAKRRISPYSPHRYSPITWKFSSDFSQVEMDYTNFDIAMERYLDEFHFNSFRFGGLPAELNGNPRYSPEYNRQFKMIYGQIQEHLRAKGWLDKVYWYWVDEPPIASYSDILPGFQLLKEACPDMHRLLTFNHEDAPAPYFYDSINLWVPIFNHFNPERSLERQTLGEKVWWYVCTGPKAPYPNNFIDHPAINHRIRSWMVDKYQADGCLYWRITYWRQNPWEQAMSVNQDGGMWGNGDGRLIYPPQRDKPQQALIAPPVTSIRFENLRDGLEDAEYLYMLKESNKDAVPVKNTIENMLAHNLSCFEQNPFIFYYARSVIANNINK